MATAPADQLKLLEVAELDSQIARLERDNVKHPLREKLAAIMNAIAARGREKELAEKAVSASEEVLSQAEVTCAGFQAQISDKEAKLNSGEGLTSRAGASQRVGSVGMSCSRKAAVSGHPSTAWHSTPIASTG